MPTQRNNSLENIQVKRQSDMSNASSLLENTAFFNSNYDFKSRVFPENLGNDYQGHYMVININVPNTINSVTNIAGGGLVDTLNNLGSSRVDQLRGVFSGTNFTGLSSFLPRFTRRISESIALYMPSNMVYNSHNVYEDISLSALAGKLTVSALRFGGAARAAATGRVVGGGRGLDAQELGRTAGQVSQLAQSPINPAIEVLFANTLQRQFVFEFLLAPRNEKESESIKTIIKSLRFHAAPETNRFTAGLTWVPPAEFDISFFKDGRENTNIPRINTSVLERVEVDYSPTGIYSTFSNGHPVAVRLSLGFRELEPVHKARVNQGF